MVAYYFLGPRLLSSFCYTTLADDVFPEAFFTVHDGWQSSKHDIHFPGSEKEDRQKGKRAPLIAKAVLYKQTSQSPT